MKKDLRYFFEDLDDNFKEHMETEKDLSIQNTKKMDKNPEYASENIQNLMTNLNIVDEEQENALLNYKISKILRLGILRDVENIRVQFRKENKQNIVIMIDKEHIEQQKDVKLIIKDQNTKLAEIKTKNFYNICDECKLSIRLLKKMKKIKVLFKIKEEAEYSVKETVLYVNERENIDYLLDMHV